MIENLSFYGLFSTQILLLLLILLFEATQPYCRGGESSKCLMVYREGGAPAVFQSPKCPRWKLSNHNPATPPRCDSSMLQGRRHSQEDRTLCALHLRIPFPGAEGPREVIVGIVAVFDGHNGHEASEMASKLLLEYFVLHTYFLLDATYSDLLKKSSGRLLDRGDHCGVSEVKNWNEDLLQRQLDFGRFRFSLPEDLNDSIHLDILKEALLRAIGDIDTTFSKEAPRKNLDSGSTATVILIADGHILAANIGDSKAFLCSEKHQSPSEAKAALLRLYREKRRSGVMPVKDHEEYRLAALNGRLHFFVKTLTRDHHPDQDDERLRVETAGGYVVELSGVHRINGQLAISRAIGDLSFKRYGVTSAPEVTDWQPLNANDSYLVAASDGVFEKMSMDDVCDILWEVHTKDIVESDIPSSCSYSLADCILNAALEKGSMDNLATVVVPLQSSSYVQSFQKEYNVARGENFLSSGQNFIKDHREEGITSDLAPLDHAHPAMGKFDRLLVEQKHNRLGCFYLYEQLDEHYTLQAENDEPLHEPLDNFRGGPINLYSDQNLCLPFGLTSEGVNDRCMNPEGFASFIGFLESIPFNGDDMANRSNDHGMPSFRYVLKRRFGRGSYGEVWLAFHWNCQQAGDMPSMGNKWSTSSTDNCSGNSDGNLFILKRIMVERGAAVYLSGLREKYFGELFLNASTSIEGLLSCGVANSFFESEMDFSDRQQHNGSTLHDKSDIRNFGDLMLNRIGTEKTLCEEGFKHIARYVESIESRSNEIWLIFHYEGTSLSKLIYTAEEVENNADEKVEQVKHAQILRPSKWWHWLKTTKKGQEEMQYIIWQLLVALKSCHDRNITHRDIKPENMVICFEDPGSGRCLKGIPSEDINTTAKMRIIDFGSAFDEFTLKHLYGTAGPSRAEQTHEYSPPEAFLNASWYQAPTSKTKKYDMWSVGVVILELVLGSPNVFQINSLTQALLDQHLEGWNETLKELAYKLRSFMEMCILVPGSSSNNHRHGESMNRGRASPVSWKCSEECFSNLIKSRDPLNIGFPNVWAMRLVRQLLVWDPEDRLSVDDALRHPYFHSTPGG